MSLKSQLSCASLLVLINTRQPNQAVLVTAARVRMLPNLKSLVRAAARSIIMPSAWTTSRTPPRAQKAITAGGGGVDGGRNGSAIRVGLSENPCYSWP
jgi:hypothetical protein